MKTEFYPSPGGADVMLRITSSPYGFTHRIVLARHELQELKIAIENYQGKQPFRALKKATGGGK